jgi:sterol 3beta-glucosyltransferase
VSQLPGGLYAADIAEKGGLPMVQGSVMPMTRTRAFPMVAFPTRGSRLPGYNQLTYWLAEQLVWGLFRKAVNRWRRESLGLGPSPFLRAMHLPGTQC